MKTTLPARLILAGCLLINAIGLTTLKAAEGDVEKKSEDRYAVPTTDKPQDLVDFIQELRKFRPNSAAEALDHRKKAPKAIFLAADRILDVEKDQSSEAYRMALAFTISKKVSGLYLKSEDEQAAQYAAWKKQFEKATWGEYDVSTAKTIAEGFEEAGNYEVAYQAFHDFAHMLEGKKSNLAKKAHALFEASARRVKLPGTVLELTGTRLDGKKFDLKSLRGKVVLIDFFATWCGPCLEEVPNLRKAYDEYHGRGFEIVSISIDEDRDAIEGFLKQKKFPWIVLHEQEEGGQHPAMEYYGIEGIPAMFLVDKEGKVVSLDARGKKLQTLLKELLPGE